MGISNLSPPKFSLKLLAILLLILLFLFPLGTPMLNIHEPLLKIFLVRTIIYCNSFSPFPNCQSCILGKHIKLPFFSSSSNTLMIFDILHCDLWISPVLSSVRHRYYVILLDDFKLPFFSSPNNFIWTLLIGRKSQVS